MSAKIVAVESCGPEVQQTYVKFEGNDKLFVTRRQPKRWSSVKNFFYEVFLPVGFPESVSSDYVEYQIWDSVQAFASCITGTLATQAVLTGVGVGDQTASVLAATTTWIMKDGMGMIGRILFTWYQGSNLDYDSKKWRLFADVLNDAAIALEMTSPYFRSCITPILCVSSLAKILSVHRTCCGSFVVCVVSSRVGGTVRASQSIVGVAGGATRAALTQHQARNNNVADVSAKDGSQETLVNLAAFLCSLLLLQVVLQNQTLTYGIFVAFTALHVVCNYRAVSCVVMETFNRERFKILARHFLKTGGKVASVADVNREESVWPFPKRRTVEVRLGVPVSSVAADYSDICRRTETLQDDDRTRYLLKISKGAAGRLEIDVVLHEQCTVKDQMEAIFHAFLLEFVLTGDVGEATSCFGKIQTLRDLARNPILHERQLTTISRNVAKEQFELLWKKMADSDWRTDYVLFGASDWRAVWNVKGIVRPEHSHLRLETS